MHTELFAELKAALMRRNPGIEPLLQPGLPADSIRKQLKRVGVKGNVDPIVELYSWHNGMRGQAAKQVYNLGFAPPTVTAPLAANVEFLRSLGHKVDPNLKVYGTFTFFDFESALRQIKLWKKFAHQSPLYARLVDRFVPFFTYSQTGQLLALDSDASANLRIISIQPENMKTDSWFRLAYSSLGEFLRDAILRQSDQRATHLVEYARRGHRSARARAGCAKTICQIESENHCCNRKHPGNSDGFF